MASSTDRETFVYIAKLAEQAERYDGYSSLSLSRSVYFNCLCFHFFIYLTDPYLYTCLHVCSPNFNRRLITLLQPSIMFNLTLPVVCTIMTADLYPCDLTSHM